MQKLSRAVGVFALLLAALLWGSSFPAIKIVISFIDEATYTWVRSAIALTGMTPYIVYHHWKWGFRRKEVINGLITGIVYSMGLWLQAWGTKFTTASNSAFITGLNVVFVHVYDAVIGKGYQVTALASLFTSITGLYFLTGPRGGMGVGEVLVLLSAFFWAAQVILVSNFSESNPFIFTFYEMVPALAFILLSPGISPSSMENLAKVFPLLTYLGLVCSVMAFVFQVYGQRWLRPYEAALIFLLEPVFATFFSAGFLGEKLAIMEVFGAVSYTHLTLPTN